MGCGSSSALGDRPKPDDAGPQKSPDAEAGVQMIKPPPEPEPAPEPAPVDSDAALDDPTLVVNWLVTLMAQIMTGEMTEESIMGTNNEEGCDFPTHFEELFKQLWTFANSSMLAAKPNVPFLEFMCGGAIASLMYLSRTYPAPTAKCTRNIAHLARDCNIVRRMFRMRQDMPVKTLAAALQIETEAVLFTRPVTDNPLVPPYAILDDRSTSRLLLVFTGCRSQDALLLPLKTGNQVIGAQGGLVHQALLLAAQQVYEKEGERLKTLLAERPGYNLHILGHSAGGSIAALLGLILRNSTGYRSATMAVTAFGPLPTMTYSLCEQCRDFATSVVLQNDAAPRLSPQNLTALVERFEAMANDVFEAVRYEVQRHYTGSGRLVGKRAGAQLVVLVEETIREKVSQLAAPNLSVGMDLTKLYPPGRLLYVDLSAGGGAGGGGPASPSAAPGVSEGDVRCGTLEAVILRRAMFRNHRVQAYHAELERVAHGDFPPVPTELETSPSGRFY